MEAITNSNNNHQHITSRCNLVNNNLINNNLVNSSNNQISNNNHKFLDSSKTHSHINISSMIQIRSSFDEIYYVFMQELKNNYLLKININKLLFKFLENIIL
jgi:hypothetical protein